MRTEDSQLLHAYAKDRDADSFRRLLERHLPFVYGVALRQCGDSQTAQDVAQAVFVLLSQKAGRLKPGTVLKGWLFTATRQVAANVRRAAARRKTHEREAAIMRPEIVTDQSSPDIAPHLDDALSRLSESDRQLLFLRFFEDQPIADVGQAMGISEFAAKKRLTRALDRLRHRLLDGGVEIAGASLPAILTASGASPFPAQLLTATLNTVLNSAHAVAAGGIVSLANAASKAMSRARFKLIAIKCAIAAACAVTAATVVIQQSPPAAPHVILADVVASAPAPDAPDAQYDACCQVLKSIVDAYDRNDPAAVQSLFYFKPTSDPKTIAVMDGILEMQVAGYRLKSAAVSRFGMHGTMLFTDITTEAECIAEYLSRIAPQNARLAGDTLTISPSPHAAPEAGYGPASIHFVRDGGVWKLDAERTFRVSFRASRPQPVAGESSQQAFTAAVHLIASRLNAIADDIDKGKIPDEAETQRQVSAAWIDFHQQFREFGCSVSIR